MEEIISKFIYLIERLFYLVVVFGGIYWVVSIIRVFLIERKINKKYSNQNKKIQEIKNEPVAMPVINGRIARVKEEDEFELEELKRKRRFILDKIPLLRK